jgi:hypothetical protein
MKAKVERSSHPLALVRKGFLRKLVCTREPSLSVFPSYGEAKS